MTALLKFFKEIKNIPLYFKNLNLRGIFKALIYLTKNPSYLKYCIRLYLNTTFSKPIIPPPANGIIVKIPKYDLSLLSCEQSNISTIFEIFFSEIYGINFKDNSILIDIGFNIGTTSLYFAGKQNIDHIYAFEPFKKTFQQAMYNLSLNPVLAKKITAYNYGLSDKNDSAYILYSDYQSNAMSTCGNLEDEVLNSSKIKKSDIHKSVVILKRADEEINKIISAQPGKKIILKINCEGAEYEILDLLNKSNVLKNIDIIMAEWHFKGPEKLLSILNANNFISFLPSSSSSNGLDRMIYAARQK